jgi:uncharacterized C2H2 Zn-finger protein
VRTQRREFPAEVVLEIERRATDETEKVRCERCGVWVKSRQDYQIDHVIAEGIRPAADKGRRLTAADGQLLCALCHPPKTREDVGDIARAKRREAKQPLRTAAGEPALMRRGFRPAGDPDDA